MQVASYGGVKAVQHHKPVAVRCTAPSWTSEVRLAELVACQSAPAQAVGLACARRLRRLTPLPCPSPQSLRERAVARSVSRTTRQRRAARWPLPRPHGTWRRCVRAIDVIPCSRLCSRRRGPEAAHPADDCRRHAMFMAKPSNAPLSPSMQFFWRFSSHSDNAWSPERQPTSVAMSPCRRFVSIDRSRPQCVGNCWRGIATTSRWRLYCVAGRCSSGQRRRRRPPMTTCPLSCIARSLGVVEKRHRSMRRHLRCYHS